MYCHKCRANVSNDSLYCHKCGADLLKGVIGDTENELTRNIKIDNFDLSEGEKFGDRYKIIEELGRGGMGRVYKAEDCVLGTVVALKIIRPEYLSDKRMIERFKKEILLAREITNENVVRIHDFGEEKGVKFITMNYIEGRSLKEIINDEGPLTFERILSIAKDTCKGLIAVHKKGIIHRDLKPQNIMIGNNDHVYLTDFGLAKSTGGTNVSQTGLAIGTPQYIAPEQWMGEEADKRSDIYTLGIVLYEMVTGKSLFTSDTDLGYLQKHLNEKPVIRQSIKDELPLYFIKIILKCLEKERNLRYQNAEEVLNGLEERIFVSTPVLARIKHLRYRKIKLSPAAIAALIFITILLLKLFIPGTMKADRVKRRSVAILSFKNLSGLKKLDHLSNSLSELLITDLGQSKFIKVMPEAKLFKILNETDYTKSNNLNSAIIEEINEKGNINYLIYGSFVKSGEFLRITAKLLDLKTGELVDTSSADTEPDRIFPAVDRLTRELKRSFKLTDNEIFEDIDTNIENITTSSQEALKCYIEGKRYFNLANYEKSLTHLKKAVKIDPEFAMGYRQIAWAYSHIGDLKNREKYFSKTIKHTEKLSERERLLIFADYYGEKETTFKKSLDYYNSILKIYPDDIDVNYIMGISNRSLENWEKAIKFQTIVLNNDRSNVKALEELVVLYCAVRKYDEAHDLINKFSSEFPSLYVEDIYKPKFLLYLVQGKTELSSMIIDKLNTTNNSIEKEKVYFKGKVHFIDGNWDLMLKEFDYQKKIVGKNIHRIDLLDPKYIFLLNGKFKKVKDQFNYEISQIEFDLDKISLIPEELNILYRAGDKKAFNSLLNNTKIWNHSDFPYFYVSALYYRVLGSLMNNEISETEKRIDDFIKNKDKSIYKKKIQRMEYFLMGEFNKLKKNFNESEHYYLKAVKLLPGTNGTRYYDSIHMLYYYSLADLYYQFKKFELSEKLFRKVVIPQIGRYSYGDLYSKSNYYLAKIYQLWGWKGKSIESYNTFYQLWKNGDPVYTDIFITDTKNQLESLE